MKEAKIIVSEIYNLLDNEIGKCAHGSATCNKCAIGNRYAYREFKKMDEEINSLERGDCTKLLLCLIKRDYPDKFKKVLKLICEGEPFDNSLCNIHNLNAVKDMLAVRKENIE